MLVRRYLRLEGRLLINIDDSVSTDFGVRFISLVENTFFKVVYTFSLHPVYTNLMDLQYGLAMAQAFCRGCLTAEAEARCGIYGGQSGTGTGFSAYLIFPLSFHQCFILIHVSPTL